MSQAPRWPANVLPTGRVVGLGETARGIGRSLGIRGASWLDPIRQGTLFWVATQIILVLFTWVTVVLFVPLAIRTLKTAPPYFFVGGWGYWDGIHYRTIAWEGFSRADLTAFYPLYPLLVRAFGAVVMLFYHPSDPLVWVEMWGGLFASHLSALVAFIAVAALARRELGSQEGAWRALVVTATYPFAFFLATIYPQATLLAAVTLTLFWARSGRWLAASGAACAAALTHQAGVALALPLAWEFARQHGWLPLEVVRDALGERFRLSRLPGAVGAGAQEALHRSLGGGRRVTDLAKGLLVVASAPFGLVLYMAYLWHAFGNPLIYQQVQRLPQWDRHPTAPWTTAHLYWEYLGRVGHWGYGETLMLVDGALWVGLAILTILLARRQPFMFTLWVGCLLLFCVISPTYSVSIADPISGTGRFLTAATPLFVALAGAFRTRPALGVAWVGGGMMLQSIFAGLFLIGRFVG